MASLSLAPTRAAAQTAKAATEVSAEASPRATTSPPSIEANSTPTTSSTSEPPAAPEDSLGQCIEAHRGGQFERNEGRLRAASAKFAVCAEAGCPKELRRDCLNWLDELKVQTPSVSFRVLAGTTPVTDVRLTCDGIPLADKLDGKAILVDPGSHTFNFEATGYPAVERFLLINEGDRFRSVDIQLVPQAEAPPPTAADRPGKGLTGIDQAAEAKATPRKTPLITYVLLGTAAAGGIGFAAFGYAFQQQKSELEEGCGTTPKGCNQEQQDSLDSKALFADISLGVMAASLVGATITYFVYPGTQTKAAQTKASGPQLRAQVTALPGTYSGISISGLW